MSKWWDMWFVYSALLMREGMAYGGLPFLDADCLVENIGYIYLIWNG